MTIKSIYLYFFEFWSSVSRRPSPYRWGSRPLPLGVHSSGVPFGAFFIPRQNSSVSNLQTWLSKTWLSKIDTVDWQNPAPVPGSEPGSGSGPLVAAARCAAAISGPGPDPDPDPGPGPGSEHYYFF